MIAAAGMVDAEEIVLNQSVLDGLAKRPLGDTQNSFLNSLCSHRSWGGCAGWMWSTRSETARLIESLEKRGLAVVRRDTHGWMRSAYPTNEALLAFSFVEMGRAAKRLIYQRAQEREQAEAEARRPVSIRGVLASLSEEEARLVYHALAQWVDNEREVAEEIANGERHMGEPYDARTLREHRVLSSVVEKLEAEYVRLAEVTS